MKGRNLIESDRGLGPLLGHWRWDGAVGTTYLYASSNLGILTLKSVQWTSSAKDCICPGEGRRNAF